MEIAPREEKLTPGRVIFTVFYILFFPAVLLFLAGDWFWIKGWIFGIGFLILCYGTIIYLYINDPALLLERYRKPGTGGQKGWDIFAIYGIVAGFLSWIIIMPLDAERFAWSPVFPFWLTLLGMIFLLLSAYFLFAALRDNSFASPLVRIQTERKQIVVSGGVYGFVRHPMYLGGILGFIGGPLFFGSVYGLGIALLMVLLFMVRIHGEERTLARGLPGYDEYRQKVKYRLIPFVW